ncbi:MAG: NAD(+) diphosphatase [Lachnospiraceae bacterium]|nr:NAD(+) diphosphatase [Lachnospiraceae bacterium]
MIQDIYPSKLYNQYTKEVISKEDYIFCFDDKGRMLVNESGDGEPFPKGKDVINAEAIYLFSVDDKKYFMAKESSNDCGNVLLKEAQNDYNYYSVVDVRDKLIGADVYSAFTAYHLWKWYNDNKYCGKCGCKLTHDSKERALRCESCGNMVFPRINPAVIVGVINNDKILITKYRTGYAHSALVAGFTEIGETLEETVAREVMEETGIKVKNIRYYKSQPWGMAQDILMGFYCEPEGDTIIKMDENELKYAEWVGRDDVKLQPNNLSLTNEMMQKFKEGSV